MIRKMTHHRHHLGERNLRIGVKIWLFFMLFVCVVFLLMWLFQIIFLEWFYESMKIRDTAKLAQQLVSDYGSEDFSDDAQEISLQNEMCIELLNSNGREVYYNCVYNGKCLLHGKESGTLFYLIDLQNSSTGTICRRVSNPTLQNEMLVYGCTMYSKDDGSVLGYLLLNSPLVPVESSVRFGQSGCLQGFLHFLGIVKLIKVIFQGNECLFVNHLYTLFCKVKPFRNVAPAVVTVVAVSQHGTFKRLIKVCKVADHEMGFCDEGRMLFIQFIYGIFKGSNNFFIGEIVNCLFQKGNLRHALIGFKVQKLNLI